jgi:hypothetical protein
VATHLNNLALLLQATNRLEEAEPLMRRMVSIFKHFNDSTGHEHPHWRAALTNYSDLLEPWTYRRRKSHGGSRMSLVTPLPAVRLPTRPVGFSPGSDAVSRVGGNSAKSRSPICDVRHSLTAVYGQDPPEETMICRSNSSPESAPGPTAVLCL